MSAQLKSSIKYPGSLVRPRFEPGLLLLDEDLTAIVDHTRALSRPLFRSLFGCGVICGFRITAKVECGNLYVTVAQGVALDCCGDPIEMCEPQTLGILCAEKLPDYLWVKIRRSPRDHNCAPRDVVCPSDDSEAPCRPTRAKDCFELTLTPEEPKDECGCPPVQTDAKTATTEDTPASAAAPPSRTAGTPLTEPAVAHVSEPGAAIEAAAPRTAPAGSDSAAPVPPPPAPEPADYECHIPHYCGVCACGCECGEGWVVLAKIGTKPFDREHPDARNVDYRVRRFIRPQLAADPLRSKERDIKCTKLLTPKAG
jgi:hypothetical protein